MKPQKSAQANPKPKVSEAMRARAQDAAFIEKALKRWRLSSEATADVRRESLDDFKFRIGEQWPPEVKRKRGSKVCLTINRTASFVNQVTNEQRQQRPAGTINPVGDLADKDTADIFQGLVRHVEVNSDAEVADDIAFEHMVVGGFGWLRLWSEDIDDDPNNPWQQEIKYGAVENPFTVYDDPSARHPLKIDAKWRFFVEDIPIDDYKELYGDKTDFASLEQMRSVGDTQAQWISKESIRIAEYFHIEYTEETLYLLADGSTVTELAESQNAIKTRKRQKPKVVRSLINAVQRIEEDHDLPGTIIPSIPVLGYALNVDGKQYLAGLVRTAKDAARAYNYHLSAATQIVAIASKAPFIAEAGQVEGYERQWQSANTGDLAYLPYKAKSLDGNLLPKPERDVAEPPIQAITHLLTTADTDLKAVTGLFDPSLGQKSPDQSGKAIVALQRQGNVATSNFSDNLARSKREITRLMLQWIPVIYDTAAVRRIIKPDGTVDHVGVFNSKTTTQDQAKAALQEHIDSGKIKKIYDIGVGRYDVTVSVGPSYQTKRQEQAAAIMQLISAYPELMHVCGDILINDLDFEQAKEIAERLKRTIPPNILGQDDGSDPEQTLTRVQAEMQQLMQQHAQMAEALNQANQIIQTKGVEAKAKMDVEKLHAETQITIAEINTKAQIAQTRLEYEHDMWGRIHDSAHDVGMQKDQQEADAAQAQQAQAAAAQSQAADQDHQQAMQEQQQQAQPASGAQ